MRSSRGAPMRGEKSTTGTRNGRDRAETGGTLSGLPPALRAGGEPGEVVAAGGAVAAASAEVCAEGAGGEEGQEGGRGGGVRALCGSTGSAAERRRGRPAKGLTVRPAAEWSTPAAAPRPRARARGSYAWG